MSLRSDLGKQSVNAVKWSALGTIVQFVLQLGSQIVLARILGPENYGLFAMGMVVLTFSNFVADFGFAWNLVQAQTLHEDDIRFVFTWQLISGSVVAAILFICAPAIAGFFKESRVEDIVRWLSLACIINAITAPATNLLRRKLDLRALSIIQVASYAVGYLAIGIPLAYFGAGVWALVAAWLSQALCNLLLTIMRHPHSIKPLFWYSGALAQSGMGLTVFVTNICNWLLNNLDRVLLGRFLNAQSVGLYAIGYNLANTPNSLLIGTLQPAFLTTGARIQSEPEVLRRAYLSVIATVWILIAPLFVLFAIVAQDLVGVLYGPAWASSGIVLAILALAMPAYVTWGMSTPILWNTERKHWESLLQLPILAAAGIAYYHFSSKGVVVVGAVAASVLFTRAIAITTAACGRLGIKLRDLRASFVHATAMVVLAVSATVGGLETGRLAGTSQMSALIGGILFGGGALLAIPLIFPKILGTEVSAVLGRFSPSLRRFLDRSSNKPKKND